MRELEVFFDYVCPYCLKGHEYLVELLHQCSDVEVIWRPCESHPRPEQYGVHSDLCIQGMFYASEQGVDIWEYHRLMYNAALKEGIEIEEPTALANCLRDLFDPAEFLDAINNGSYEKAVYDANLYAYEKSDVWVVPAYRMDGRKLDSVENVGMTKQQLVDFLKLS